jgi:hypothetical protein
MDRPAPTPRTDLIEISGSPPLEGKDGFYGSYLNFVMQTIGAAAQEYSDENRMKVINLIEIGIALVPDPNRKIREEIYDEIENEISGQEKHWRETHKDQKISMEDQIKIRYHAYIRCGLGGLSTWYDKMVGVVTKNVVSRTGRRG